MLYVRLYYYWQLGMNFTLHALYQWRISVSVDHVLGSLLYMADDEARSEASQLLALLLWDEVASVKPWYVCYRDIFGFQISNYPRNLMMLLKISHFEGTCFTKHFLCNTGRN